MRHNQTIMCTAHVQAQNATDNRRQLLQRTTVSSLFEELDTLAAKEKTRLNKIEGAKREIAQTEVGLAWRGLAWFGLACLGLAWLDLAWLGLAWLGLPWLGLTWLGLA